MHVKPEQSNANSPLPYILRLPDQSLVRSGDKRFCIDENAPSGGGGVDGPGEGVVQKLKLRFGDPFPKDAVAEVPPNSTRYVKTGNAWLLATPPAAVKPLFLCQEVPGHSEYWIIEKKAYTGRSLIVMSWDILFNVPLPKAIEGGFADEDRLVFAFAPDDTFEEEVTITIDLSALAPEEPLVVSIQVNTKTVTRGQLAKELALEVEKALSPLSIIRLAFINGKLRKEVRFKDLFFVELSQRTTGVLAATLAARVRPSEDILEPAWGPCELWQ
ncbi:hypothetical protein GSI_10131 [Ganoderma sinense ZZ0214-1]|uniref:Uncharacterized protein n=1 Tax=Ganoderma sinense ZZ0214-1 TaxID=1077348 RepID=A0A2G8RZP9_9APHY|nr:hypothetical protein GSI_10131 [Ganoderma sinense ZZ0214-1]